MIAHFEVLVEHAEKLEFQTAVRDLAHLCFYIILELAVFSDPNQFLISNSITYLGAWLFSPVSEDNGAADRRISFSETLHHLHRSGL